MKLKAANYAIDIKVKNVIFSDRNNLMDTIMKDIADILKRDYVDKYKELYHMDGFWFPNGEFVLFEDSQDERLYKKYKEMIFSLVDDYLKM